jgi:hypothetical protein
LGCADPFWSCTLLSVFGFANFVFEVENYITHVALGNGTEIPIRLTPGEVLVATEK